MAYLQQVKQQNSADIFRCLWKLGPLSRVELVEHIGLTSGTVTNLTHEWIERRVLRELEAVPGHVGRRRIRLGFDPDGYRIAGLDIGRSSIEIVVTDLAGSIVRNEARIIESGVGPEAYLRLIRPLLEDICAATENEGRRLLGLGVGVPGPLDEERGGLLDPPNFPGWAGFPLRERLREFVRTEVRLEDDARTSALAERWYGIGKDVHDLVFVKMGIGIGSGVISGGEIVRGINGLCGQVGHITVVPGGQACDCGNRGCWETVGSIPGILRRWGAGGGKTLDDLKAAARRGEPKAQRCVEDTLAYLETALTNIYNVYDPELVVLGGRLYPFLADALEAVRSRVRSRLFSSARDRLRIEPSTFGESQSAVGAAAILFRLLLTEPIRLLGGEATP